MCNSHLSIPGDSSSPKELSLLPIEQKRQIYMKAQLHISTNGEFTHLVTGRWTRTWFVGHSSQGSGTPRNCHPAGVALSLWERWRSCSLTCHTDTSCCGKSEQMLILYCFIVLVVRKHTALNVYRIYSCCSTMCKQLLSSRVTVYCTAYQFLCCGTSRGAPVQVVKADTLSTVRPGLKLSFSMTVQ